MIKMTINQEKCAGCGLCVNDNSHLFKIDTKNFKAKLKQKNKLTAALLIDLPLKQLKEIEKIIKNCPAQAITTIK